MSIIYAKDKYGIGKKNELIFRHSHILFYICSGFSTMGNLNVKSVRTPLENGSDNKLNITDLNQFCLEHIFTYLDLEDLLNVADANKHLRPATIGPFTQKYGTKWIKFNEAAGQLSIENDQIKIHNFKTFFQMLRCFGQSIHKLDIFDRHICTTWKCSFIYILRCHYLCNYCRILDYMNEFCAEALTNVEFYSPIGFEYLEKPFANIEYLTITKNSLLEKKCLGAVFPKLKSLRFPIRLHDFSSAIVDYFPTLQHLELDLRNSMLDNCKHAVIDLFRLNSHIKSLKILIPNFSCLGEISDHLQAVENLDVHVIITDLDRSQFNCNLIHFSNVKQFNLKLNIRKFRNGDFNLAKLPFQFDQLKEFFFRKRQSEYNDLYSEFLSKNPTIEKLTFGILSNDDVTIDDVTNTKRLQKMLPSLNEISFDNWYCIDYFIKYWANDLKTVKRINFRRGVTKEQIRKMPVEKWHAISSKKNGSLLPHVTLERIEALNSRFSHNVPFKHEFLFCNCSSNKRGTERFCKM